MKLSKSYKDNIVTHIVIDDMNGPDEIAIGFISKDRRGIYQFQQYSSRPVDSCELRMILNLMEGLR